MSQANVTLSPQAHGPTVLRHPVVVVGGAISDQLRVDQLAMAGPWDVRSAVLSVPRDYAGIDLREQAAHRQWLGQTIRIERHVDLGCDETQRLTLFVGCITELIENLSATMDVVRLRATDWWADVLDESVTMDAPRRVGDVINAICARLGAKMLRVAIGRATLDQSLRSRIGHTTTVRSLVGHLSEHHGITVRQIFDGTAPAVAFGEVETGRPVILSQGSGIDGVSITARRGQVEQRRPIKRIVRADGEQVEATFDLQPAWQAADALGDDADYASGTSSDWPRYANVFRLWLLNETGELGDPRFDLGALIGDGRSVPAGALRFGRCLTQDGAGRRLEPFVEFSVDGGTTWQTYPGRFEQLDDRAGIRLTDDVLPSEYSAAARATGVQLRVTATLQSPLPIERIRWMGNPFAGPFKQQVSDVGLRYQVRRVTSASRFAADVESGARQADQVDDTGAMNQMLADRVGDSIASQARTYHISRVMPGLSIGDRLIDGLPGPVVRLDQPVGAVRRIEHRWDNQPGTTIETE